MEVVVENTGDFLRSGWPRFVLIEEEQLGSIKSASEGSGAVFDVCAPTNVNLFLERFSKGEREFALSTLNQETQIALSKLREFS